MGVEFVVYESARLRWNKHGGLHLPPFAPCVREEYVSDVLSDRSNNTAINTLGLYCVDKEGFVRPHGISSKHYAICMWYWSRGRHTSRPISSGYVFAKQNFLRVREMRRARNRSRLASPANHNNNNNNSHDCGSMRWFFVGGPTGYFSIVGSERRGSHLVFFGCSRWRHDSLGTSAVPSE